MPPPRSAAERPSPNSTAASEAAAPTAGPYAAICSRASLQSVAHHVSLCKLACLDRSSTGRQSALWQLRSHMLASAACQQEAACGVMSVVQAGLPALCDLSFLQWSVSQLCNLTCLHGAIPGMRWLCGIIQPDVCFIFSAKLCLCQARDATCRLKDTMQSHLAISTKGGDG